jgi:hypothetical protein
MKPMRKLVSALLLLSVFFTAAAVSAGCRRAPVGPKTPEELAVAVFGKGRPDTLDPGVYEVGVTAEGEFTVKCRLAVVTPETLGQSEAKLAELFEKGFKFENVTRITVVLDCPFRDKTGNFTIEKGLSASISRAKSGQLNWSALSPGDLAKACDEWWVDPRLQ